jgi:putative ATP-binding cassette transporter
MRGLGPFLKDAWHLARPYFTHSDERWSARGLLLVIVALNLSLVGMSVVLNFWNRAIYNSLQDKDWHSFVELLFWYRPATDKVSLMPGFCGIAVVYITIAVYRTYLRQWMLIRWRRWLTEHYLTRWLANRAYYRINLVSAAAADGNMRNGIGTDNPDQRIADDLDRFCNDSLVLSLDFLSNIVSLFSFLSILWTLSGSLEVLGFGIPGYMVWVALLYSILGTWLTHLIGRPLALLNFNQQRLEANFRFALVRLRENVEGIALYRGEAEEHRGLSARFAAVVGNWWQIMQRTKKLNAFVAGFGQIADVFPIVVASPRYFSGVMTLGDLFQTSNAFGRVQGALSWFVDAYASLAQWRATVERLTSFQKAIEAADAAIGSGPTVAADADGEYRIDEMTLALPNGQRLLADASFEFEPGQSVVISGRSGSGKSTLFRALAGIWPFGKGHVHRPAGTTSLFLPQRPYIPLGTLRHAVTYPAPASGFDDATVRDALRAAGLAHLEPRLDDEDMWAQRLSGGEQQRLAMARALLSRPDWLFLDEATASLDPEAEAELYATLKERLPKTTFVSIAHRPAVTGLHERHLVFERLGDRPGRLAEAA